MSASSARSGIYRDPSDLHGKVNWAVIVTKRLTFSAS